MKKAGKKYSRGKGKSEVVAVEAIVSVFLLEERRGERTKGERVGERGFEVR